MVIFNVEVPKNIETWLNQEHGRTAMPIGVNIEGISIWSLMECGHTIQLYENEDVNRAFKSLYDNMADNIREQLLSIESLLKRYD